jgi:methylglyoxal synthase
MDFNEIAALSGKGGLFKIVSPTRAGVILEALDESKKKVVASVQNKVSVLSDISIYTTDEEGAKPLKDVMLKIHNEFKGDTGLSANSDGDELKSFLKFVLPEYDESRVYVSDIKKLVTWYNLLVLAAPELFEVKEAEKVDEPVMEEAKTATKKTKK